MSQLKQYKVIGVDNENRESVPDVIIFTHGTKEDCEAFAEEFIATHTRGDIYFHSYYPRVVGIDYKLWTGMEEFI